MAFSERPGSLGRTYRNPPKLPHHSVIPMVPNGLGQLRTRGADGIHHDYDHARSCARYNVAVSDSVKRGAEPFPNLEGTDLDKRSVGRLTQPEQDRSEAHNECSQQQSREQSTAEGTRYFLHPPAHD
jgi:hypothetical protein